MSWELEYYNRLLSVYWTLADAVGLVISHFLRFEIKISFETFLCIDFCKDLWVVSCNS